MSWSYDPTLPTDRDFVRFLTGDTSSSDPLLSDEEIDAVLSEETATGKALKYFAAARVLSILLSRWSTAHRGAMVKTVSRLSITWGVPSTSLDALNTRISELRARGAWLLTPNRSRPLRIAGNSLTRSKPE